MSYYDIIAGNFQATIETIALSVDDLAHPIEASAHLMTETLLQDGKILTCGSGVDATLSQLLASQLLGQYEHERPALPALALSADSSSLSNIAHTSGFNETLARPLRALGQPGDVLFCISSGSNANTLLRAVQAAHERNMRVIALSNSGDNQLGTLIRSEDVEIRVSAARQPQVVELHTMIIHCLCELIEHSLFGTYSRE
tara:strand:+ start:239181 stop:239780 length:600 start_codon:yes stop_codon:yes gene_type:complete